MKKSDLIILLCVALLLSPFFIFDSVYHTYLDINRSFPLLAAFIKFAILSTFGEVLGVRIKTGKYTLHHFGLFPRAVVWGFLGMWIALSLAVFRSGVPAFLDQFSCLHGINAAMGEPFSGMKLFGAFVISVVMNTSFAPVFMTIHKITDTHIAQYQGKLNCFCHPVCIKEILSGINWNVQWGFVFKKTIPFFWIPAHTITFILPKDLQVLFAALCGVALGVILAIASLKKE